MRKVAWVRLAALAPLLLLFAAAQLIAASPALAEAVNLMPGTIFDGVEDPTGNSGHDLEAVVLSADQGDLVVGFYLHGTFYLGVNDYFGISIDDRPGASDGKSPGHELSFSVHQKFGSGSVRYEGSWGTRVSVSDDGKQVLLRIPAYHLEGAASIRWQVSYGSVMFLDSYDYVPDESYSYKNWRTTQLPAIWTTTFPDVPPSNPYYSQILTLAYTGVVGGYSSGNFGPNDPVTRQQFAKMIVKTLGLTVTGNEICGFSDVKQGLDPNDPNYPDKYVAVCVANGITSGQTATKFAPAASLTRAQLITMVARAAGLTDPASEFMVGVLGNPPPFDKFDSVHYPWARRAWYAGYLGDLQGIREGFDFFRSATRGEVCAVLYHLLESGK